MFGCAVMTGTGAILNTARMPEGSSAAVVGLGGVGLAALLAARVLHAEPLIALDVHEHKLATARALGATVAFDANRADCIEQVRDATQGGVEFAFEMAGSTRALETAYRITRRGGTTVTAGLSHPAHDFCVRHVSLVTEERTIKGSYLGSCAPGRDIPRYVELYQSGRLPVDRLLSERFGLDEINTGFDRLAAGESLRQMVIFD
jgi:alcohol dehydrogenase